MNKKKGKQKKKQGERGKQKKEKYIMYVYMPVLNTWHEMGRYKTAPEIAERCNYKLTTVQNIILHRNKTLSKFIKIDKIK